MQINVLLIVKKLLKANFAMEYDNKCHFSILPFRTLARFVLFGNWLKVWFVFQISRSPKKIIPKNYPELEICISCLLIWAGSSNFKLEIVFGNNCFGRFEKRISLSEKLKKKNRVESGTIMLNLCTLFVRGCWGQVMLLFWKLVDETKKIPHLLNPLGIII